MIHRGPQRARLALLVFVVAVHLGLMFAWRGSAPRVARTAPVPRTIQIVMLPALPEPMAKPLEAHEDEKRTRRPPSPAHSRAVAVPERSIEAGTAPAQAPAMPSGAVSEPTLPAAPAPPLNLELPRSARLPASSPSLVDRAINDPRANSARLSFERRMSADFDQAVTIEVLADGTKRYRQGAQCMLGHPSRAGQLDPFDRVHNQQGGVEKCP